MESVPAVPQKSANEIYNYAATLLYRDKRSYPDTMDLLKSEGLDEESASTVIDNLETQMKSVKNARAKKDMLYGALWCIGGTVLTLAHIGFIFWGAIIFGAIQFFKGVASME